MSGVTLAVGPPSDPAAGKAAAPAASPATRQHQQQQQQSVVGGVMGSLRVIELQLVAFIMVFSASGLVPLVDVVFPIFASLYVLALSRLAFPAVGRQDAGPGSREIVHGSRTFRAYVVVGTTVGLFLPLAYVLGGFARGDEHAVRSATPHLFLLSFQILTENIISGLSLFSPPVRAMVPLLYTVRRIFVIVDWMADVWINKTLPANAAVKMTKPYHILKDVEDLLIEEQVRRVQIRARSYKHMNLGFIPPRLRPLEQCKYSGFTGHDRSECQANDALWARFYAFKKGTRDWSICATDKLY